MLWLLWVLVTASLSQSLTLPCGASLFNGISCWVSNSALPQTVADFPKHAALPWAPEKSQASI